LQRASLTVPTVHSADAMLSAITLHRHFITWNLLEPQGEEDNMIPSRCESTGCVVEINRYFP
jgi:hypothetical protein